MATSETIRLLSVNAATPETLALGEREMVSGIRKRPLSDGARITELGIKTDAVIDQRHHGGPDQALYLYSAEDYAWWSARLDRNIPVGTFGENLTVEGLTRDLMIGDRLMSGGLILEVTGPRIPCRTLGMVMGDEDFTHAFRKAARPGAYCRVLRGDFLRPGDQLTLVPTRDPQMSVREMFELNYKKPSPNGALHRALASPLAQRLREKFAARLNQNST